MTRSPVPMSTVVRTLFGRSIVERSTYDWIGQVGSRRPRERGQVVLPYARRAKDVHHSNSPHHQCIRDEGTVTAPGNRLGAHDRDSRSPRQCELFCKARRELGRLHVVRVRVATKVRVAPAGIARVGTGTAVPTEPQEMRVANPRDL